MTYKDNYPVGAAGQDTAQGRRARQAHGPKTGAMRHADLRDMAAVAAVGDAMRMNELRRRVLSLKAGQGRGAPGFAPSGRPVGLQHGPAVRPVLPRTSTRRACRQPMQAILQQGGRSCASSATSRTMPSGRATTGRSGSSLTLQSLTRTSHGSCRQTSTSNRRGSTRSA